MGFVFLLLALLALSTSTTSAVALELPFSKGPRPGQIKNLVTFGDSYTDVVVTGDHGISRPVFAAQNGNLVLFPFARAGATCSNNITFRPFPSVFGTQLPIYFAEKENGTLHLRPDETIYTLWIGTNDVGANSLIVGEGTPGATVVNTTACAMIPLQKTILYSADSYPNTYWTAERNTSEWNIFVTELTRAGNALSRALLELLAPTLPGFHIGMCARANATEVNRPTMHTGYFDSHTFFEDMLANPGQFCLTSPEPFNSCGYKLNENTSDTGNCTTVTGPAVDSYFWCVNMSSVVGPRTYPVRRYDELHPSEQTNRNVGKAIAAAIRRTSERYTTWIS
ncbi:carbohydrate esterase family 16 protein [Phanerochaete carnosa HHB-10118-sp]|uniref:Carbohydrate esterase family 16 protein n=1 Tax=Phanerochaete carnosa (strain HHB-10118-sp) TaxID=650164 RepID=K5UWT0_PHACS|nr:carbohydrate esterase family 16 protein [Phanerochaete carnosa HHB-10118-sp]EKM54516.1 carbohydrate esterase family 16 protein [Phanerochaete carnosa HHB-10118-sp]